MARRSAIPDFETLVREHHGEVWRSARRVLRSDEDAQDVIQEVFLRVLDGRLVLEEESEPRRVLCWWSIRIALNIKRGTKRRRAHEEQYAMEPGTTSERSGDGQQLWSLVEALPDELRLPVVLRFAEGLGYAKIGDAIGVVESTAHDRVQRGLAKLRALVAGAGLGALALNLETSIGGAAPVQAPVGLATSLLALRGAAAKSSVPAASGGSLALAAASAVLLGAVLYGVGLVGSREAIDGRSSLEQERVAIERPGGNGGMAPSELGTAPVATPEAELRAPVGAADPTPLSANDARGDERYVADIEFLLDAFEEKAGHLLRQKNIDWDRVRRDFTKRARKIESDQELITLARHLTARLEDGHARVDAGDVDMSGIEGGPRYGCGVDLYQHKGRWYVRRATGAAAASGVVAGWRVEKIDRGDASDWMDAAHDRLVETHGFSTEAAGWWAVGSWGVVGPEGEGIAFEFKTERRKKKKKVTLTWGRKAGGGVLTGPLVLPDGLKMIGRDVGWARLPSGYGYVWIGRVPGDLHKLLDSAIAGLGEECAGMILDFRSCLGGGYDRDALLGRFVPKGEVWGNEKSAGPTPFTGDLIVLIDPSTISAGETIVGELKEEGRAYLIGPGSTHGASGSKETIEVPSGLFSVRIVVRSNKLRFNGGRGVEGIGIAPHEIVEYDPDLLVEGIDPAIARAVEVLGRGIPRGAVSYRPPPRRR